MQSILIMSHKMNLGGTEKALLSFLNALEGKNVSVTLLLLEAGGLLFDEIPKWVQVAILPNFEQMQPVIFDPPLQLAKQQFRQGQWGRSWQTMLRYIQIKSTKKWYLNYIAALKNEPNWPAVDTAIAFAGPSDFISYYIHAKVPAKEKIQWIHFDVSQVIYNTNFGKKFYPYFDKICCVSENAQLVFNNIFPEVASKTMVFRNIVSKSLLQAAAAIGPRFEDAFDGFRIVTVGRLSPEKGQDMIPAVVRNLLAAGLHFRWYLIGSGALYEPLQQAIDQYQIGDALVLLGSQNNPYAYMQAADVYVQTSLHEGYCLTIHEAKMFDKPVVTTAVASASNLIAQEVDGLIVPISEAGLTNGIKRLLTQPALLERFQQATLAKDTSNEIDLLW